MTVRVPSNATTSQLVAAINARTSSAVGDVSTTTRLRGLGAKRPMTIAWELGRGATAKRPWGASTRIVQTFVARS